MAERGLVNGDWIEIASDNGTIDAMVEADETIRPGVVSMSHGFGGLPEDGDYLTNGASANLLISTERDRQAINGMRACPASLSTSVQPMARKEWLLPPNALRDCRGPPQKPRGIPRHEACAL